ncbi:hypothetical protein FRC05_005404 [Tulasnella sp. 425]|nr:hypothetical protein FRC05_005404 [Tulasnella sp. 425]
MCNGTDAVSLIHDDDDTYMWKFLETPAPLLQKCVIRGSWDEEEDTKPLELLGGDTSNLRYVNISVPSVRWKMGMFTQLKALSLSNAASDGLTIGHTLDFLRASPCLEYLDIGGVDIAPVGPPASPVITLPYLKSINLYCNSTAVTGSILRHIQMPSCNRFIVSVDMRGEIGHMAFIKETFNPFREILRELHVRNGGSKFSIHSRGFGWESFPILHRKYGFSVHITGTLDPLAICWVDQILQKESGLQVDFNLLRAAAVSQAALEALAPMQCVTGASIEGFTGTRKKSVSRIFRFLSSPLSSRCSLPSLPCLRELLISTTGWTAQELLDMVQFRSSAFPDTTTDRPKLAIKVWRGASTWSGSTSHIFNLATLTKLRSVEGVESLRFIGERRAYGYSLPKKPGIVVAGGLPSGNLSCVKLESVFIVQFGIQPK